MKRKDNKDNKAQAFLKKYQLGGLTFPGRVNNPDYIESLKTGSGGYPKRSSDDWQQLAKLDSGDTIVKADTGEIFLRNNKDGKYFAVDMKQVEHLISKKQEIKAKPTQKLPTVKYRGSVYGLPKSTQDYSTKEETKLQKEWLQKYMKSDLYKERLKAEGFKNPEQEANARLNNLNSAPIKYVKSLDKKHGPGWVSGEYFGNFGKHEIKMESEFRPENFNPTPGFETIPLHEMYHASDRGGKRIPKQTIKNIQERTNTPTNGLEKYYTTPTEFIGRIQPTRYLLQREGIYDASKKVFDEKDYENMLNNRAVRENTHFQEFYENVKGSTPEEKRDNFIWFMNNIAQVDQPRQFYGQLGGTNFFADATVQQNPYDYAPDLQTAQQQQLVQYNQPKNQQAYIPQPQSKGFGWDAAIPLISPAINLGIGVKSIIDSFGEKKRQQQYERAYRRDLDRRREEARTDDYYYTPYGVYGTNYGSYQGGGLYQPNQLDFFIDFYNQKEGQNDLSQSNLENWYTGINQRKESQWRNKRSSGFQNLLSGATGILGMFQQGGTVDSLMQRSNTDTPVSHLTSDYFDLNKPIIKTEDSINQERASYVWNYKKENPEMFDMIMGLNPDRPHAVRSKRFDKTLRMKQEGGEYNPKVDLYSPDYDPNEFLGIENEVVAAQIEDKESSAIESWLFQDEPELDELNLDYFNPEQTESTSPEPIEGLRDMPIKYEGDISSMGKSIAVSHNNPGNIKMGKFAEKYGATPGRGATDGGLFARFPDVKTGLKAQRDLLKSGSYANLTVKDAMKRWSNSGYGADLFPEIADKPMYLLTEPELIELQRRQIQREDPNMYQILYLNS